MNQPETRFIFDWQKNRWDYRLPVLIGISLFLHIFCFYIFHVVYPTTTSLLPPAAQVTVLDPARPQDKSLLDWVAMNNPANVSAPRFDSRILAKVMPRYKPIYSSTPVDLKRSDSVKPQEQGIPSIFSPETLLPMRALPSEESSPKIFSTRFEIASTLQSRAPVSLPPLPVSLALSEPTSIFIGVNPEGEADYVFLTQSSGNGALDQKAEEFTRMVKFKTGSAHAWGMVTFRWGGTPP
jgi:hypothetical protein